MNSFFNGFDQYFLRQGFGKVPDMQPVSVAVTAEIPSLANLFIELSKKSDGSPKGSISM